MGGVYKTRIFYGVMVKENYDDDELEPFKLRGLYIGEDNLNEYVITDEDHIFGGSDEFSVVMIPANTKIIDEKLIKFLQVKNIKRFKGPAWFAVTFYDN